EVFNTGVNGVAAALKEGPVTPLEAGIHPLVAEFSRLPGPARLQLTWKAPHFYPEPLPHTAVRHLPAKPPARLAGDRQVERGRFLAEELSCARCHQPAKGDPLAQGLLSRQGPDLSNLGGRAHTGWIYHWLVTSPAEHPGRATPALFGDDEAGRTESY